MTFSVFTADEMRTHYAQAADKKEALRVLADCSGSTVREISRVIGLSKCHIKEPEPVRERTMPREIDPQAVYVLLDTGMSLRQIGRKFGVSHQAINLIKKKREANKND